MWYDLLADVVVAFHVAYVSFVVVGLAFIMIGAVRGWGWVRNRWFRLAHLTAITVVAVEAIFAIPCPLTMWEEELRTLAGQQVVSGDFLGRCVHGLIFYDFPPWVFPVLHIGFAILVAGTLILVPPRWRPASD